MKRLALVIGVLICLLCNGCDKKGISSYDVLHQRIELGMSEKDLIDTLGMPASKISRQDGGVVFCYFINLEETWRAGEETVSGFKVFLHEGAVEKYEPWGTVEVGEHPEWVSGS